METEEKTISSESTEDTKACDSSERLRQVDEDSENVNLCSSPDRMHEKLPETVVDVSDDGDMIESNEERCSDFSDAGRVIGDPIDNSKNSVDVCYDFGTSDRDALRNEPDDHIAIKNEIEEGDGESSVELLSGNVNRNINCKTRICDYAAAGKYMDSIKTSELRFKEQPSGGSESCDVVDSEVHLLVEENVSHLPVEIDTNVSDIINDEDAHMSSPTKSRDANQEKDYNDPSCVDHSSAVQPLSEEKSNYDSDMDLDNDDMNSDPEFLSSKFPNEYDPDGSTLSFMNLPNQSETEAPKLECEAQINEDLISAMLFTPEDVIIECKDKKNFFYCNVCHCTIHNSIKNVKVHKKGKSHKAAMIKHKKAVVMAVKNITLDKSGPHLMFLDCYVERYKPRGYYCRVCNFIAEKLKAMDDHVHGKEHETNICIMKTREIIAQQKENIEKGTKDEMKELDEEYYKILENERLKSWNSYSAAIMEELSKNKASINVESCYNTQDPLLYRNTQDGLMQNQYYQNFMHTMKQDIFSQAPGLVDVSMNPDTSQIGPSQKSSIFPYTQQNPVPNASELRQAKVSTPSQCQKNNSFFNVPFSIKKESDAEVVFDVLDSLLQNYLKFKLGRLPKSLFKLPHSSKPEENARHINKFPTGRIAEQDFRNLENSKNRYQSALSPNDARLSPDLYRSFPNEYIERKSYKRTYANETAYSEKLHDLPKEHENYRSYKPSLMEDETNDSYHYLCPEDQIRRPVVPRSINTNRQNERNFSRNSKEAEFIIDESSQYKSSYKDDDSSKRMRHSKSCTNDTYRKYKNYDEEDAGASSCLTRQNESPNYNFLKQYRSSINEQNESFINNLPQQYQQFSKKDNNAVRNTKQLQPYTTDSSGGYARGPNIEGGYSRKPHQSAQSVSHLMKKFRNSNLCHY